jgi:hypothetical protein
MLQRLLDAVQDATDDVTRDEYSSRLVDIEAFRSRFNRVCSVRPIAARSDSHTYPRTHEPLNRTILARKP